MKVNVTQGCIRPVAFADLVAGESFMYQSGSSYYIKIDGRNEGINGNFAVGLDTGQVYNISPNAKLRRIDTVVEIVV